MQRNIYQSLISWYENAGRKPLVLRGARQVGKTFAVNFFGEEYIQKKLGGNYHYLDLKEEPELHSIFQENQKPQKIIQLIELRKDIKINLNKDLIFIDEIQECPSAISTLKYFEQNLKKLAVIAAGSHLGLMKNEASFPIGKVNFLSMFPMTIYEFIRAIDEKYIDYIDNFDIEKTEPLPTIVHQRLLEYLNFFFATGGMPEVVAKFITEYKSSINSALKEARKTQKELLIGYHGDFSKYSGTVNANHIHHVFDSIPKQLCLAQNESTNKFKFTGVIPNQKGFDRIVGPLTWLTKSRLCIKSFIAKKAEHPLLAYSEENIFKVFFMDIGLLNAALNVPMEAIITNNLSDYKGYVLENFVAQEIYYIFDGDLISWREGQSEIEFLITEEEKIIPLEVKSSTRSRRSKSLDAFIKRYQPKKAFKLTGQNFGVTLDRYTTLPLYLISKIFTTRINNSDK